MSVAVGEIYTCVGLLYGVGAAHAELHCPAGALRVFGPPSALSGLCEGRKYRVTFEPVGDYAEDEEEE